MAHGPIKQFGDCPSQTARSAFNCGDEVSHPGIVDSISTVPVKCSPASVALVASTGQTMTQSPIDDKMQMDNAEIVTSFNTETTTTKFLITFVRSCTYEYKSKLFKIISRLIGHFYFPAASIPEKVATVGERREYQDRVQAGG